MERKPVIYRPEEFPEALWPCLQGAKLYDSSCSPTARVWFVDREEGYYLKSAPAGALQKEATLTAYFHGKGLAPQVCRYLPQVMGRDWMLTCRAEGEDCTHATYLADPKRLASLLGERLRMLHELDGSDCPIRHTENYLATARKNYEQGCYDPSYRLDGSPLLSMQEAWSAVEENGHRLRSDTLLHGDYCLPNVMLKDWKFSAFIDVDRGGLGDRHVDIFWGLWTLQFNLKTNAYADRFLDAYGREVIEREKLSLIGTIETFG